MAKRKRIESGSPTLFEMGTPELHPVSTVAPRPYDIPDFYLGTSSFTANGWVGTFYPKGMKSNEYLSHYSKTFRCVEIDSTFYATPAPTTLGSWYQKTPADFVFAAKVPQAITHEKALKNCDAEFSEFMDRMALLKEKLGSLLLQFPVFNKYEFKTSAAFLERLVPFLGKLPKTSNCRFVVEIRNRAWLDERFLGALREHNVALALTDTNWIPRPWELSTPVDLVTADFAYVRWLGHRKQIEGITSTWDKTVIDRSEDLKRWVQFIRRDVLERKMRHIFLFANNHYSGYAPATVQRFWELWRTNE